MPAWIRSSLIGRLPRWTTAFFWFGDVHKNYLPIHTLYSSDPKSSTVYLRRKFLQRHVVVFFLMETPQFNILVPLAGSMHRGTRSVCHDFVCGPTGNSSPGHKHGSWSRFAYRSNWPRGATDAIVDLAGLGDRTRLCFSRDLCRVRIVGQA